MGATVSEGDTIPESSWKLLKTEKADGGPELL